MDHSNQIVDQLAKMLAERRLERLSRRAAYVSLARAILADVPQAPEVGVDSASRAA